MHNDSIDSFRYWAEAQRWRKWFDSQPFWYRWKRKMIRFLTGKPL